MTQAVRASNAPFAVKVEEGKDLKEIYLLLKTFINNEETKILRNGSGQVMEVYTSNFNFKYYDQIVENNQQPYTITFEYIQVGSGE